MTGPVLPEQAKQPSDADRLVGRRQNVLGVVLIGPCVVIIVALWIVQDHSSNPDMKQVGRFTGMHFPATARLLNSELSASIFGGELIARLELSHTDAESFVKSGPEFRKSRIPMSVVFAETPSWWRQGHSEDCTSYLRDQPGTARRSVIQVCPGRNGTDTVFIVFSR